MLAWWPRDWFPGYVNVSVSKKKNEGVNHSLKVPLSQADLVRHHHRQVLENQGCQATHGHQGYQVYHRIQHHLFLPFVQEYRKYRNLLCHLQKQAISNQSMWCWILFKKHQNLRKVFPWHHSISPIDFHHLVFPGTYPWVHQLQRCRLCLAGHPDLSLPEDRVVLDLPARRPHCLQAVLAVHWYPWHL